MQKKTAKDEEQEIAEITKKGLAECVEGFKSSLPKAFSGVTGVEGDISPSGIKITIALKGQLRSVRKYCEVLESVVSYPHMSFNIVPNDDALAEDQSFEEAGKSCCVPDGWRRLNLDEETKEGDKYWSTDKSWQELPAGGLGQPARNPTTVVIRSTKK